MGDVLERVNNAMRVIISRVDAPLISRVGVTSVPDTVGMRVLHVGVHVLHVNLKSQSAVSFLESTSSHLLKELQVLLNALVSVRTVDTLLSSFFDLFSLLEANVSLVLFDELDSELVEFVKVVGRGSGLPRLVSEPVDDILNVIDELVVLLARVGVIKSQVAVSIVLLGYREYESNSFSVSNM